MRLQDLHNTIPVTLWLRHDRSDATLAALGREPPLAVDVFRE